MLYRLTAGTALLLAAAAQAAPIPAPVAAMIDAAAADPAQLKTVADIARKTNPDAAAEIDAHVAALAKQAADAHEAKLAAQGLFEGWKGEGELGAFVTTGNTKDEGVAIGAGVHKETLHWRHRLHADVDYQRSDHVTTKERWAAGYEANYKFSPRFYALGVLLYEHDKFAGYDSRFTEGVGLGYKLIDKPRFKLDVEAGPALRQTNYFIGNNESNVAGRAAVDMLWQISPTTALTEVATGYFSSGNTTLTSTTALTAKLVGALSARASFNIINESDPPLGRKKTDTTTRATLVYSF